MSTRGWESATLSDVKNRQSAGLKPSKYRNVKTVVDGITFDSAKEAKRYQELVLLERAGKIARLKRQQSFELITIQTNLRGDAVALDRVMVVAHWIADFTYDELSAEKTQFVVEDVKGLRTAGYKAKKRHFEAQYGIEIRET